MLTEETPFLSMLFNYGFKWDVAFNSSVTYCKILLR